MNSLIELYPPFKGLPEKQGIYSKFVVCRKDYMLVILSRYLAFLIFLLYFISFVRMCVDLDLGVCVCVYHSAYA